MTVPPAPEEIANMTTEELDAHATQALQDNLRASENEQVPAEPRSAGTDPFLLAFLAAIEEGGLNGALTLMVGGFLVSGIPISEAEYRSELYSRAKRTEDDDAEETDDAPTSPEGAEDRPTHVTFKDASVLSPTGQLIGLDLWRGDLRHVAGWAVGGLKGGKSQERHQNGGE